MAFHSEWLRMVFLQEKHTFRGLEHPKNNQKSNKKPFKIDARKNDAKIMQNLVKMESKWNQNRRKINSK